VSSVLLALVVGIGVLGVGASSRAAGTVTIEDWHEVPNGFRGVPPGWRAATFGPRQAAFDFQIIQDGPHRALHLQSVDERSTIIKDLHARIDLRETPVLEWDWKAVILPAGGDARRRETSDHVARIYLVWRRLSEGRPSRIIGYVWDTTAPQGTVLKSPKTSLVTFVVVRSGAGELNHWLTEQRNVSEDHVRIFRESPGPPAAISITIDSNDTHSRAEALIGAIRFRAR
jgi:hypothetical protein